MKLKESKYPILRAFADVYDNRQMYFNIVHGKEADKVRIVEDFLKDLVAQCDFSIFVTVEAFARIVKDDYIRNIFETGQGTTSGGAPARKMALENLYGVSTDGIAPADFPKYGALTGHDKRRDLMLDPDLFWHYGSVMLTLRKQNMMDRTTLTVGSSIDFNESILKTPTPVTDPKALCVKGMPTQLAAPSTRIFNGLAFLYDLITTGKLSPKLPNSLATAADGMIGFEDYELQFHGRLQFSKDVESVTVFPLRGDEYETVLQHKTTLDKYGIKVENIDGF